jgi:hypothetical protein
MNEFTDEKLVETAGKSIRIINEMQLKKLTYTVSGL